MPGNTKLVVTAAGFFIDGDVLWVYYGYYLYKESHLNEDGSRKEGDVCHEDTGMGYVATKDGDNWSASQDMNIPMVPNHGPQKTASGRIIITGNVIYPYTDRSDGVSGYQLTGIYGDAFQEKPMCDDSESIHQQSREKERKKSVEHLPYVMQFEGMYRGGLYGYPHTLIHDGYLYIIYSKRKESVEVTKLALEQLK